jgi:hypothetical protein
VRKIHLPIRFGGIIQDPSDVPSDGAKALQETERRSAVKRRMRIMLTKNGCEEKERESECWCDVL